jgi:hypothetical protein
LRAGHGQSASRHPDTIELFPEDLDVIVLHAAVVRLAALDRRQTRLLDVRRFGGLTGDEKATVLGPITRKWKWELAREPGSCSASFVARPK